MSTTPVFAEIVVIGLEVEAWLALVVLTAFGWEWIDLAGVKDFAALITILVIALAYVLGILADRIADTALDKLEKSAPGKRIKKTVSNQKKTSKELAPKRMAVMHRSPGMIAFLDYQRSRWRIARATVGNLLLAGPLTALFLAIRVEDGSRWALVTVVCTAVVLPVTYFGAVRIQDAWVSRLNDAFEIVERESS